jgi:hypothetical protein
MQATGTMAEILLQRAISGAIGSPSKWNVEDCIFPQPCGEFYEPDTATLYSVQFYVRTIRFIFTLIVLAVTNKPLYFQGVISDSLSFFGCADEIS